MLLKIGRVRGGRCRPIPPHTTATILSFDTWQSTPTIDGEFVYALSSDGILVCLEVKNRKVLWKKDLVSEYDVTIPSHRLAGSPVIEGDLLILTANTSGIALYKKTGKMAWDSKNPPEKIRSRHTSTGTDFTNTATPVIYDYEGKRYAVLSSYEGIHSVEIKSKTAIPYSFLRAGIRLPRGVNTTARYVHAHPFAATAQVKMTRNRKGTSVPWYKRTGRTAI